MKYLIVLIGLVMNISQVGMLHDHARIPFYIKSAADYFKVDAHLLYAICKVESNCKSSAVNHNDGTIAEKNSGLVIKSYGLFQIKLTTAEYLGFISKEVITVEKIKKNKLIKVKQTIDHTKDLLKPEVNAWYAAKLVHILYKRYGTTSRVISAYNAGHPVKYNKDHVNKVTREFTKIKLDRRH